MRQDSCGTPVCPALPIRAQWHQTTVRAWGVQDVTTHAPLRSRRTQAQSVCHVRGLGDGDTPTSPIKIQGYWRSLASGGSASDWGTNSCLASPCPMVFEKGAGLFDSASSCSAD